MSIVSRCVLKLSIFLSLIASSCTSHVIYEPCDNPCPPEPVELPEKIRVALVLGSGGVKGMAHVGVLEVLEAEGIEFDLIVGCSAGSFVGALYCDHPCSVCLKHAVGEMRRSHLLDIKLFSSRYGLSQGTNMKSVLCHHLSTHNFAELEIPLVLVATDLYKGELVPIGSGDLITAVQASCTVPFFYAPVTFQDRVLIDGGVINPVPVVVAKDLGADIIIAVDLCDLLPQTFPENLFGVAKRSAEIAFFWQNSQVLKGADVVIKPSICQVGIFDDSKKDILYCAGREAALSKLPEIREIMALKGTTPKSDGRRLVQLPSYCP